MVSWFKKKILIISNIFYNFCWHVDNLSFGYQFYLSNLICNLSLQSIMFIVNIVLWMTTFRGHTLACPTQWLTRVLSRSQINKTEHKTAIIDVNSLLLCSLYPIERSSLLLYFILELFATPPCRANFSLEVTGRWMVQKQSLMNFSAV